MTRLRVLDEDGDSPLTFDATVEYEEADKAVVHDISIQLSPKRPRPGGFKLVKRRKRVTRRKFTGRYRKIRGGFASESYAGRYPHLVRKIYKKVTGYRVVTEERAIPGAKWTEKDAFQALWAAHKIVQKGGDLERDFTDWTIEAIDWRKGKLQYEYGRDKATEILGAMGGIFESETTTLRVGLIDRVAGE